MHSLNPFEVAHERNILIIAEPLGNIHGYYSELMDQKIIHVNDNLHPLIMDYVTTYLLMGNEFLKGFHTKFFIQKSFRLWTPVERKAHRLANAIMKHQCNTVLERLTNDDISDIAQMLDRVWSKDPNFAHMSSKEKMEYVKNKLS